MSEKMSSSIHRWSGVRLTIVFLFLIGLVGEAVADATRVPNLPAMAVGQEVPIDPNANIVINGDLTQMTPQVLAQSLVGDGIEISNVTYVCDKSAAGTFTITGNAGIGLSKGIILSSGAITNVIGPNNSGSKGTSFGLAGDADLDKLLPSKSGTHDACVLEFDFVPNSTVASFKYVFGSEEYNEYVNSNFNDVFGFFVNGTNCAVIGQDPVTINTINNGNPYGSGGPNSEYYINNSAQDPPDGSGYIYNTQLDGFTKVLTCSASVNKGSTNHIKLAIADVGDYVFDSAVFIGAQSFVSADYAVSISPSVNNKSGNNTTTVKYILEVRNLGGKDDSYNVALSGGSWPTVFGDTGTTTTKIGPLAPLEVGYLYVNVAIPNAAAGSDIATVTVTSIGSAAKPVTASASLTTKADGVNTCIFVRDLPPYYIPGIAMPVSIHAVPTCFTGSNFFALEDNVPPGWTVDNSTISNDGSFLGGKVNYFDLPLAEATLTYMVKPPLGETGEKTFSGSAGVNGVVYPVTGPDTTTYNAGRHPADMNSADWKIGIGEYTGYGSFWKSGKPWPGGWNPITLGFVVKAAEIWAKNVGYHFDGLSGLCPNCWVAGSPPAGSTSSKVASAEAATGSMTRTVAAAYQPGVSMPVSLQVTPPASTTAYGVEESFPAGWTSPTDISNGGSYDAEHKLIKWGIFMDSHPRTLTYSITPAANATGEKTFSGTADFSDAGKVTTETKVNSGTQLTVTGSGDAHGTVSCQSPVNFGSNSVCTITPAANFHLATLTDNDVDKLASVSNNSYTISNVQTNHVVEASFALTITVTISTKPMAKAGSYKGFKGTLAFTASPATTTLDTIQSAISTGASWVHIDLTKVKIAKGKGTVPYTVDANFEEAVRTGTITIGNATYSLLEGGTPCTIKSVTFTPLNKTIAKAGGQLTLNVDVEPSTCQWSMATKASIPPWFEDHGNFPSDLTNFTGDQSFSGTVGSTEKAKTWTVTLTTLVSKVKKTVAFKQLAK